MIVMIPGMRRDGSERKDRQGKGEEDGDRRVTHCTLLESRYHRTT